MAAPSSDQAGIRQAIRALKESGYTLVHVDDREETYPSKNQSEDDAIENIMAVDDAFLVVEKDGKQGWVRFVMGNDPEEVICDYTVSLEDALGALTESWSE